MITSSVYAAFMIGFLGGAHCIGMCGGISAAVSFAGKRQGGNQFLTTLLYNLGRITSYSLVGAIAGYTAEVGLNYGSGYMPLVILRLLSGLLLILLGLYVAQINTSILILEKIGHFFWRFIQPLAQRLLPLKSPLHAYPLGLLWGWLPCGLVYSTLSLAVTRGNMIDAAFIMFAFGLGTLPLMLLIGNLSSQFNDFIRKKSIKLLSGLILTAFGLHIIYIAVVQITGYVGQN